jgi:hypothetical protein
LAWAQRFARPVNGSHSSLFSRRLAATSSG